MADPIGFLDVVWRIGAVLLLVFLNGFFVAAEFAIVKVRVSQLAALGEDVRTRQAQDVVKHLDAYLSATQLGITLASLGLGWIGEPAVAVLVEPALAAFGITSPTVVHTVAFAVAFTTITFLHIVLGELAPKSLAIQKAVGTTLAVALPLRIFYFVFKPAINALNGTANYFLRLVGIKPASEGELAHSEEELRFLFAESGRARALSRRSAEIMTGVLDLRERTVGEVMVPRPQITALATNANLPENARIARESGYTRFPLARDSNLDDIVGMVHLKDLVWFAQNAPPSAHISALKRDVLVVPETLPLDKMLNRFLARRAHMALVVDEYGGTAGLVTLEDVLEEFLGEIQDEFDTDEAALVSPIGDDEWIVDGTAPLHRVAEMLEAHFESEDVNTFGGYVVEKLGRVPTPGTEVDLEVGFRGVVRSADRKRVKSVHVTRDLTRRDPR